MTSNNFVAPVFNLAGNPTTAGDIVTWNATNGTLVADSGKLAAGLVSGPGTSAVGDVALWNNTTGTLLEDSTLNVTVAASTTTLSTTAADPTLIVTVPRATAGVGFNNTVQAGAAQSGASNTAGGDLFLASGISTGTGRSNVRIQTPTGATTGSTDNTEIDRVVVVSDLALTSGTAATIVTPTIAAGNIVGGFITYSLRVTGGTSDLQNESSMVFFSAVNKAGSITRTTTQTAPCQALTAGTLTTAWSVSAAGLIQVTATSSLSTPVLNMVYEIHNQSFGAITF
jgi:hypothetical protein